MSNIIDKIQLSGVTYDLPSGSGNPTVELTQAEYDALVSGGTVDPDTFYIITDATPQDMSQYWTSAQTSSAITQAVNGKADSSAVTQEISAAVSGKQDTLISGTNIKTINNESILGSGNINIQGGGKAIEAGRGISITTGETADTVSFNLPISANTNNSVVMGGKMTNAFTNNGRDCLMVGSDLTTNNGSDGCLVVGYRCSVNGDGSAVIGWTSRSIGDSAFAFGTDVSAKTSYSFATGHGTLTNNNYETVFGKYNQSNTGSTDASNTLFSVGNGTADNARHNAFEIRKNGDIYLTKDGQDIKLQDNLGSSITVDTALDSGSTNPVANSAITNALSGYVVETFAKTSDSKPTTEFLLVRKRLDTGGVLYRPSIIFSGINGKKIGSLNSNPDRTNFELVETSAITSSVTSASTDSEIPSAKAVYDAISAGGGGMSADMEQLIATSLVDLNDRKIDASEVKSNYQKKGDYVATNTLNTRLAEYETVLDEQNVEEVTAYALNDLNDRFGGLKIVKITESEYAALTTKDENTLYIVVADPS